ncbi:MAG: sensor histidine kinase [Anaerolineales bacterium]
MTDDEVIQLSNSRPLNLAVYLALIVLWGVGFAILPGIPARVSVTLICLAFGLVHAWGYRAAITPRRVGTYFTIQTALVTGLLILSGASDAFNFLFFILGIQATMTLPRRIAIAWILVFFLVNSLIAVWCRGADGLITILFNAAVYSMTGVFGYTLRQSELNRRHSQQLLEELRATQQQLRDLAVVEERNRLARDLHDSAKQQAFALSAQLDAVRSLIRRDPAAAETHVERAEQLADNLRQELASLILELRPPEMGEAGFAVALTRYVEDWSGQSNVAASVNVKGQRALPREVEHTLFRIAQEALANVARHSRAEHAEVLLDFAANKITLTVQDDGSGFDPAHSKVGVGTHSMQERAATLPNGTLTLASAPGRGTRVIVVCNC